MQHENEPLGTWAGGWLLAAAAGLFAAMLARQMGEVGISAAAVSGGFVFLVFGVLMGSGGVELTVGDDHDPAGKVAH